LTDQCIISIDCRERTLAFDVHQWRGQPTGKDLTMKSKKLALAKEVVKTLTPITLDDARGGYQSTNCTIYCSVACPPPTTSPACRAY